MKKLVLLILSILLITGCSNSKEKELCTKVDEIDNTTYVNEEKYEELANILDDYYTTYCENTTSEVCTKLDDYIKATKHEVTIKDCNNLEESWRSICESDNKMSVLDKKIYINYKSGELWATCNNKK